MLSPSRRISGEVDSPHSAAIHLCLIFSDKFLSCSSNCFMLVSHRRWKPFLRVACR
ncbi:unnamed protein product [Arabidopsis lyrata]|uniref:Predicted protein n=1 Tax=Arabidopsis lyrata subsp. lyrata TaxID=81972 RepID=D7LY45_ARALL|nr:predicted protein [Arabidopsis lyrata subsp. lyrata]CAH8272829.1 unnamed protein product [Arabidopsis lyrata]